MSVLKENAPGRPLVSVIQPTKNAALTLETSLTSVAGQTYRNVEHIVVDGVSTDGTVELLQSWGDRLDYWVSEPDSGLYAAMMKGVRLAHGRWVYFLGADDRLLDVLHIVAPLLEKQSNVYYGDVLWPASGRVYDGPFTWHKLAQKNIAHQAIFYPRCLFQHYSFNQRYRISADYDLNVRVWVEGQFRFKYIPVLVCAFGEEGLSRSATDTAFETDRPNLMEHAFGRRTKRRRAMLAFRASAMATLRKALRF